MDSKIDKNLASFAKLFEGYGTKEEKENAAQAQKSVEDLKAIQGMLQPFLVGSKAFDVKSLQNIQKKISSPSIQQFFGRNDKKALKTLQNINASINSKIKNLQSAQQPEQQQQEQQPEQQAQQTEQPQQNTAQPETTTAQNTAQADNTAQQPEQNAQQQSPLQKGAEQVGSTTDKNEQNTAQPAEQKQGNAANINKDYKKYLGLLLKKSKPEDLIAAIEELSGAQQNKK